MFKTTLAGGAQEIINKEKTFEKTHVLMMLISQDWVVLGLGEIRKLTERL